MFPVEPLFAEEGYVGPQGSWDLDSVAGALCLGWFSETVELRMSRATDTSESCQKDWAFLNMLPR